MPHGERPSVQQLTEQLARINERLTRREPRTGGWLGLLGGLGLGALTGGVLAYLLRSRQEEPPYIPPVPSATAPRRADDAVVLRGTPAPTSTPAEQADDEPILLKAPTAAAAPPIAKMAAADTSVTSQAETVTPTDENEALPAPAASTDENQIAPAPVEPTVENEALPAAAIAGAVAETVQEAHEATAAPAVESKPGDESKPAEGDYPGSVAPIGDHCPPGYEIKGNRSRNGDLLYHTPTSNNFARTKPEACFATEAEAEAAGFRKARS